MNPYIADFLSTFFCLSVVLSVCLSDDLFVCLSVSLLVICLIPMDSISLYNNCNTGGITKYFFTETHELTLELDDDDVLEVDQEVVGEEMQGRPKN